MKNKFLKGLVASFVLGISNFANAGLILSEVDENAYIQRAGYDVAWISPWSANNTSIGDYQIDLSYQSQFGWIIMTKAIYDEIGGLTAADFAFSGANVDYFTGNNLDEATGATVAALSGILPTNDVAVATPWFSKDAYWVDWSQGAIGAWSLADWESPLSCPNNCNETLAVRVSRVNEIPEPSTLAVFALGLMGLASRKFKKQA